ncbi:7550_t:CDS:10 [Scutellospora calospora]|uniref:7550_t:CDS:1 n=1 Tax=Scutellospora calospora TaxID=85575 RepID=A0ACA9KA57_9GLOM|nr:7550_t:CDS:10 [Scutellospora calospora]
MSLSSETKKYLHESLLQQCLNQNYTSSSNRNDTALLDIYQLEEIYSQYIIWIAEKGYTVINHPSEIYRIPDTHECIDRNQLLCLIININAKQKPDSNNSKHASLDKEKLAEEEFKPIDDDNALVKRANLAIAEYDTTRIRSAVGTRKTKILRKILASLAQSSANLLCTICVSYHKTFSNKSEAKLKELEKFDFRIGQYQNIFSRGRSCIAILDKSNTTMYQMASRVYTRESANTIYDLLNVATHVVAMDAFANNSTLAFLKFYRGSEGIHRGFKILQEDKHIVFVITSFIEITNITTSVYVEAFAQMLFRICDCSLHIVSLYHSKKFDIFKEPSVETYIKVEYQKYLLAKYFPEILCSFIASTEAIFELILVEDTEKINRNKISHTIKNTEKKIKGADAESIANTPDISFKDIDNTNILSDDDIAKTFEQSQKKIVKIRENALLLFGFKTRAKGKPDLNAIIKFINAILSNCRDSFVTQEELIAIKVNNSKYFSIGPILLLYKPESIDETQDLFDSISITNNITSECTKYKVSDLSNNKIDEKDLFLEMPAQYDAEHKKNSFQDICYVDITTFEANAYEKEKSDFLISLSSEFLIKRESDI